MYHVLINKMFSVMDKSFKVAYLKKKTLVQYGNNFESTFKEIILSLSIM